MKFHAKVVDPGTVVVVLSIELEMDEATRLIKQLDEIKDGYSTPWPVSVVKDGLEAVVEKVKNQITEELVPERDQS